ncbi:MAG: NAD-dependent epimerase/dehydratase family protein [Helicobacter sp.]|nr:NAD-dependent epimerase/dehydratase family protein [Helicobacter sp.]
MSIYAQHLASLYEPELLESIEGKTLLITGASGLIGRFFVDSLLASDVDFRLILPLRHNMSFSDSRAQSLVANICEPLNLPSATKLDAIVHLASPAFPAAYHQYPLEPVMLNVDATRHLLELASTHHAKFIFSSSCEIYGESAKILAETDMGYLDCMQPRNCYNESKRLAETLTQVYAQYRGIESIILRFPRVFGATFSAQNNSACASFLRDCAMDRDIWLKSEGQQQYSFLYVGDCVQAIAFALAKLPANQAYNVAASAMKLYDFALEIVKLNPKILLKHERAELIGYGKTQYVVFDTSKIQKHGFDTKFSILQGLQISLAILRERRDNGEQL